MKNKVVRSADILLPANQIANEKWAVVAVDQYTSEPEYWAAVESVVEMSESTFRLTIPEIYLNDADIDERIKNVNTVMEGYINEGTFKQYANSFIYQARDYRRNHRRWR